MKEGKREENQPANTARKFTKTQILASKKFAERRDLLAAVLSDAQTYTVSQVEAEVQKFMKGRVI